MIGESPLLHHRSPHPMVNVVEITKKDVGLENNEDDQEYARKKPTSSVKGEGKRYFLKMPVWMVWIWEEICYWVRLHPIPCLFAPVLFFLMKVEYTHTMVMHGSEPFDWGFVATKPLHRFLASHPDFNSSLAGLNTAILAVQIGYLFYAWLSERRTRGIIAMVFMLVGRGILGCATVLPVPEGYLGSGVDFPAGNVSFFLFYSGHVGVSYIATLDMKRTQRLKQAKAFDIFNILQGIRLLSIRGHYTIDLVAGIGAAILSDVLAGNYFESGENVQPSDTKIISSQMRLDDDRTVKGLSISECNW